MAVADLVRLLSSAALRLPQFTCGPCHFLRHDRARSHVPASQLFGRQSSWRFLCITLYKLHNMRIEYLWTLRLIVIYGRIKAFQTVSRYICADIQAVRDMADKSFSFDMRRSKIVCGVEMDKLFMHAR